MRVLSLLAVAIAGCYDPAIDDCQFTCRDNGNKCPGGLMCRAGLCRVENAPESCLCPAPPVGCSRVIADTVACLATCSNARNWEEARTACAATPGWHLAVLDTSATRTAAENTLTSTSWVGLRRNSSMEWRWFDGSGSLSSSSPDWTGSNVLDDHAGGVLNDYMCAAIKDGKLYSDDCARAHEYACTPD